MEIDCPWEAVLASPSAGRTTLRERDLLSSRGDRAAGGSRPSLATTPGLTTALQGTKERSRGQYCEFSLPAVVSVTPAPPGPPVFLVCKRGLEFGLLNI